jgi:hypothetical protein
MKPAGPSPEVLIKAVLQIQKQQAQEEWIAQYGHVRPVIATDNCGKKFVAIRNRIEYSETWKFIPDFLLDLHQQFSFYLGTTLTLTLKLIR